MAYQPFQLHGEQIAKICKQTSPVTAAGTDIMLQAKSAFPTSLWVMRELYLLGHKEQCRDDKLLLRLLHSVRPVLQQLPRMTTRYYQHCSRSIPIIRSDWPKPEMSGIAWAA